jgi:uncharacterized membrane protein YhaH (DUF805 family)
MDFMTAVKTCLTKYADFKGRATRPEFWWFALFSVGCQIFGQILGGDILSGIISLGLLLPTLAVGARRLHDVGRSAWWLLLLLLPVLGTLGLIFFFYIHRGQAGANEFGPDPLGKASPQAPRSRGAPSEFDSVMDDSYRKSRIPRAGDD